MASKGKDTGKYEIVGWYTKGGKHIPIRKSSEKDSSAQYTNHAAKSNWYPNSGKQADDSKQKQWATTNEELVSKYALKVRKPEVNRNSKEFKDTMNVLAHKGFPDEWREGVAYCICAMPKKAERDMWRDAFSRAQYVVQNGGRNYYSNTYDQIYLNRNEAGLRTIFHETSHYLDHHTALGCEFNGVERDIEPATMLDIMLDHDEVYDEYASKLGYDTNSKGDIIGSEDNKNKFKSWMNSLSHLATSSDYRADYRGPISDISSGLTHNRLGEPAFGYHSLKKYWIYYPFMNAPLARDEVFKTDAPSLLCREIIAHFMSLKATNADALKEFKRVFPTIYKEMEDIYELLCS